MADRYNLTRFLEAQADVYPTALRELQEGRKHSHWMWYIFPQLKHLGFSNNSEFYGISGIDEAAAYFEHPVLGQRLKEVATTILNLPTDDAAQVFGGIDSKKLCSSMTLFDAVAPDSIFSQVLEKFYSGNRDPRTLSIITSANHR